MCENGSEHTELVAALRAEIELLHKSLAVVENAMEAQKETIALQREALEASQAKVVRLEAELAGLKNDLRAQETKRADEAFKFSRDALERLDEA